MLVLSLQTLWLASSMWWVIAGGLGGLEFDDSDVDMDELPVTPVKSTAKKKEPSSGEKPKAAARNQGGRHKASNKAGNRVCKSCGKCKDCAEFAFNQSNCKECKAALDNISKKAKKQKQTAWLEAVLEDPQATKAMLQSYREAMIKSGGPGAKGKKKEAWSIVRYIEMVKSTSKCKKTGRDQLMWNMQALEFWKSLGGGGLSHAQAEKKWADMEVDYQDLGLDFDHEGPSDASLRLPVRVADYVDNSNSVSRSQLWPQLPFLQRWWLAIRNVLVHFSPLFMLRLVESQGRRRPALKMLPTWPRTWRIIMTALLALQASMRWLPA